MKTYHFDIEVNPEGGITYQQVKTPAPKGTITTEAIVRELKTRLYFYWVNVSTAEQMPPKWFCEGVHLSIIARFLDNHGEMKQ